ncbi:MAG TPA: 50S ribosomal protein L21 [Patescibacteria group bacterium]|nr:50S ribosomal protein L21 [Patescibacteria group bacterium]
MFAVVTISGKQYKVSPKDIITVNKLEGVVGDTIELNDVLLVSNDKTVKVGKPTVKGANVSAKIIAQGKGKKITVRRFKSKVRYRRTRGFRPHETKLEILAVS